MTLKRIESPNLPNVNHGFYTRLGGASSGIFHGLNCGIGSSDQSEIVKINRARVAQDMGGTDTNLIALHQFHSAKVVIVDDTFIDRPQADGVVSNRKGDILTILTADCQPVLFHDPDHVKISARPSVPVFHNLHMRWVQNFGISLWNMIQPFRRSLSQVRWMENSNSTCLLWAYTS